MVSFLNLNSEVGSQRFGRLTDDTFENSHTQAHIAVVNHRNDSRQRIQI